VTDSSLKISSNFNVFAWLFVRLPLGFSVPFSAISLWWGLGGFAFFNAQLATPFARSAANLIQSGLPPSIGYALVAGVGPCAHAVLVIALFLAGFVFAYNTSALVNWLLVVLHLKPIRYAAGPPRKENSSVPPNDPIGAARRIGIVLAGGGAKGAYQAGAMKAIYRFLAERGALQKVSVIASTSIGSWNALFWLADLVQPESDWTGRSVHERWWRSISAKSLVAPSWYIPFCRNAFLSPLPWQQAFERLFAFLIMGHGRRQLLWFAVTRHPTAEWLAQQIVEAFPWDKAPTYLVRDNDGAYGQAFLTRVRTMGIRDRPISPRSPWQNPYVERLIGTLRRECLDQVLIYGERHLRRILTLYSLYYNETRTHLGLGKDAPLRRSVQRSGTIVTTPILSGLHHRYARI